MAHLTDICDTALLQEAIDNKLVVCSVDESGLKLLNYTNRAVYGAEWNEATVVCRGLIVDPADRVVARPFPKFFGASEPDAPTVPAGAVMEVTDKLDGSLGIAYHHPDGDIRLCTRGSFGSEQGLEATRIWRDRYQHVTFAASVTPLFEIIYPSNRIVVDYGEMCDLVLLAVIDHETGADLPLTTFDWPGPTVNTRQFDTFTALSDHVTNHPDDTEEGYVVRFGDAAGDVPNLRLKFKFPGYVAAHRIATGLNSVTVWEAAAVAAAQTAGLPRKRMVSALQLAPKTIDGLLAHGDDPVEGLRSSVPEEFLPWYDATAADLQAQEQRLYDQYVALTETARQQAPSGTGKEFALAAQELAAAQGVSPNPIYGLNQNRGDVRVFLWTQIRPEDREFASRDVEPKPG